MENNTKTMTTASQPSFVVPSVVAVRRLRAAAATTRAIWGPVVWSPPPC